MIDLQNLQSFAEGWAASMSDSLVGGALVCAVVSVIWLAVRRRAPAQLGYLLFLLVLLKVAMPVQLPVPDAIAPALPAHWVDRGLDELQARTSPVLLDAVPTLPANPLPLSFETGPQLGWQSWMLSAWGAIVALLLLRLSWVQFATWRLVRRARTVRTDELPVDLADVVRRAALRRSVRFLVSDDIDTPAAGGIFRPYVLLPSGLLPQLAPGPLRWVLLHELAHIRRGDIAVALVQRLVQIAFFFHPAVWVANRVIDEQREFACDADALMRSDSNRRDCGAGFLSVVEWAQGRECGAVATLGMFDSQSVIRRRMMRLLDSRRTGRKSTFLSAALAAVTAAFVLPSSDLRAEVTQDVSVQDPESLRALKKELAELRRAQARLQKRLDELQREQRDVEVDVEFDDGQSPKTDNKPARIRYVDESGRPVDVEVEAGGVYMLHEKNGDLVKVKPGKSGVYVLRSGDGETLRYEVRDDKGQNKPFGGVVRIGDEVIQYDVKDNVKVLGDGKVYYLDESSGGLLDRNKNEVRGDGPHVIRVDGSKGHRVLKIENGQGYVILQSHGTNKVNGKVKDKVKNRYFDAFGNRSEDKPKEKSFDKVFFEYEQQTDKRRDKRRSIY